MRAPFTQLYIHCVWATWDRRPLVTSTVEQAVYASILDKCGELHAHPLAIGGMPDHVHLLVRLPTTLAVSRLLKEVKGTTSHLVTHVLKPGEFFKWQGGYGAFTLGKDQASAVRSYIERQREHHADRTVLMEWEQTALDALHDRSVSGE